MVTPDNFYAHSLQYLSPRYWQQLSEHLNNVADLAAGFAVSFGAEQWGKLAGQAHDLGKGTRAWQAYLRRENAITDEFAASYDGHPGHALAGAQKLFDLSPQAGKLLAYCVAGHHGGLPDWNAPGTAALRKKLQQPLAQLDIELPDPVFPADLPFAVEPERFGFQLQFFTRMLYSCLVDADYLDTEQFLDQDKSGRRAAFPTLAVLSERFWPKFNALRDRADKTQPVVRQREKVLVDCLTAADHKPGLFSLTVPTGGGKTLASLAFALNHAKKYAQQRIIYVIPFTSIIEQNAGVFREMVGNDAVLEHHCNFIPDDTDWQTRLGAENWDAPLIVTTNVQFFNSFFANKSSRCRKLHNIANSIVIFDEFQAIPVEKLLPCLEVIRELSDNYGVSSVLCTATQPAVAYSDQFQAGLRNVQEIIRDVPGLFAQLKRTEEVYIGKLAETEVADRLMEEKQVLCIVNTRQQAMDVFHSLAEEKNHFHLSALMYPSHRSRIFKQIREQLEAGREEPCRVVSTQLIEAGVDVDFPSVFRAVAGIDSIAQAAGRCNRNGRSRTPCQVSVFAFPEDDGGSYIRLAAQSAQKLFKPFSGRMTSPECVHAYFDDYFWKNEQRMDSDGIIGEKCLTAATGEIQFREIAEFQMIATATEPVIIALEEKAVQLVADLEFAEYKNTILRKLQQYAVQIYPYQLREIKDWLENPFPGVWVLSSPELYSETTGLRCEPPRGEAFFG
jgi:CRISPR-associated endonuclease/helicase Cas3